MQPIHQVNTTMEASVYDQRQCCSDVHFFHGIHVEHSQQLVSSLKPGSNDTSVTCLLYLTPCASGGAAIHRCYYSVSTGMPPLGSLCKLPKLIFVRFGSQFEWLYIGEGKSAERLLVPS